MARVNRFAGVLAFLAVVAGAGLLTGAALRPTQAAAACEDDECEGSSYCRVNTTTGCDNLAGGGCKTYGCGATGTLSER